MNIKLCVDNLPVKLSEGELNDWFSIYGNVASVHIVAGTTASKDGNFGYVTMVTPEGAQAAIQGLNGKEIGTTHLAVSEVRPKQPVRSHSNPHRSVSRLF
ncbi:MAG TPA: RNA-binding protein [Candidatus Paceibacterota bacterium]|nr:RNA-binding protein [Candidatus Paceibacterota bacterium]